MSGIRRVVFLATALGAVAAADTLVLVDGRRLEGAVVAAGEGLVYRAAGRTRTLAWTEVREVILADPDPGPLPVATAADEATYRARRSEVDGRFHASRSLPVDEMIDLAAWCLDRGMVGRAADLLGPVLLRAPGERRALDLYRRVTDRRTARTRFRLPVDGWWRAQVDGRRRHAGRIFTVYGIDLVRIDGAGRIATGDGDRPADHLAWEAPVLAPADGIVERAVGEHPDRPVARPGPLSAANQVDLDLAGGERAVLSHLRQGSLAVRVGQRIRAGQIVATVGNSGFSELPHLHFDVQVAEPSGLVVSIPWRLTAYERRFGDHVVVFTNAPLPEGAIVRAWPR